MISLEKWEILTPFQKLPKNVGDLGKIIVAKGFKKLPKVQKNRPIWSYCSSHTFYSLSLSLTLSLSLSLSLSR